MEILPITIAEPRADRTGAQADEAKDGWFDKLLRASDQRPDFRDPAAEQAPEPDRAAANQRPADDRSSVAPPPAGDKDAETTGGLPAPPKGPADETPPAAPIENSPQQRAATAARPAAKLPPAPPLPGTRTGAGQDAQLTAASPAAKATHAGPQPTAPPAAAAAKAGVPAAASPLSGHNPNAVPEPEAAVPAAAPRPQARAKPRIESRPKGPDAEPLAKPSGAGEGGASRRRGPAVAKAAATNNKASGEGQAPRHGPNVQQSFGALSGLTAAGPGPAANRAPAQQPATTAAPLGPGRSAANGNLAPAEGRPAALHSAPSGGATEQVALRIHKAVGGGQARISIKLHPAELGRIEVKLAWSDDGLMRAMISADKGETLELLQRDSRALERTLQDAGIKTDQGSLSFEARGQGGRGEASDDPEPQTADNNAAEDNEAERSDAALAPPANHGLHRGLLDLSV